ncbi:hypothetical protein J3F83DRAFT_734953 [Trichoderma novae-zelandiae]
MDLPERLSTSQDEVQPVEVAPVANSSSDEPKKQPQVRLQQATREYSPGVADAGLTAPTETEGQTSDLTDYTEPPIKRPMMASVVCEASSSASTQDPMEISSGEEDEDVIMTDATPIKDSLPAKSGTTPHSSRRQHKHRDGNLLRGKRPTSQHQQQSRVKKKQSRRQSSQGTKSSSLVERLLRSTRSSRRDSGHELWYLGDDATACPVTNAK